MANRRQRRRVNTNRISFQRHTKLSNFVSFFVPFWFLSNLAGAVTDFGFGIVLYHSYIVALVLYLILFLQNGKERFVINREVFRFSLTHGAFMIVCLLSLLVISSDNEAISQFMSYAWMSLLSVGFVATYRHTQTMHYLFWGIFLALAIVCFVNLIEFVNPEYRFYANAIREHRADIIVGEAARISGIYSNQNESAQAIVYSFFLLSFFLHRKISIPLLLLIFIPVLVTFSRAGIAMWCMVFLFICTIDRSDKISLPGFFASVVFLFCLLAFLINGHLADLLRTLELDSSLNTAMLDRVTGNIFTQEDDSSTSRKSVALFTLSVFIDNPLFGIGLGGFTGEETVHLKSHNMFLQLAAEIGILGLLCYLLLLAIPFLQKYRFGIAYSLLTAFASMFTHSQLSQSWFVLTTAIVLVIFPIHKSLKQGQDRVIDGKPHKKRRRHR